MARHDDMPRHDDPTEVEPRPRAPPARGPGATVSQLRQDIDSGATGDKVPMPDPAAAPLGTDDEAAGAPPEPDLVEAARRAERAGRRSPEHPADRPEDPHGVRLAGILATILALAAIAIWFSLA